MECDRLPPALTLEPRCQITCAETVWHEDLHTQNPGLRALRPQAPSACKRSAAYTTLQPCHLTRTSLGHACTQLKTLMTERSPQPMAVPRMLTLDGGSTASTAASVSVHCPPRTAPSGVATTPCSVRTSSGCRAAFPALNELPWHQSAPGGAFLQVCQPVPARTTRRRCYAALVA